MNSIQKTARITGLLILLMAFIAPFSMIYVPSTLIVPGDATATAQQIIASEGLFRLSMASDAVVFLIEIGLCALLYVLLKPISKPLSLVAAFARLAMTILQGINLLNHFMVLLLVGGSGYLAVFTTEQLQALALLFLNAHETVVLIWGAAFALHLLISGYLVYQSGYLPRWVGGLLIVAAFCYFIQSFGTILLPQSKALFASIALLSMVEIALPLWLLVKGVNIEAWKKRALASV
ncbi:MAG: DUF4386 domain-containing protein [Caldilineaceae bacterium]